MTGQSVAAAAYGHTQPLLTAVADGVHHADHVRRAHEERRMAAQLLLDDRDVQPRVLPRVLASAELEAVGPSCLHVVHATLQHLILVHRAGARPGGPQHPRLPFPRAWLAWRPRTCGRAVLALGGSPSWTAS